MKVVSNSSPVINLAWIGQLDLLEKIFEEIIVPEAVWNEVVINGSGQPGADEIQRAQWIHIEKASNRATVQILLQSLDEGEAESIAIANEIQADFLLMDEKQGRETATFLGIKVIGVVGILIQAKQAGFISSVKPYLEELQSKAGFHLRPSLYQRILSDQGEA